MRVSLDSATFPVGERTDAFTSRIASMLPPPTSLYTAANVEGSVNVTLLGAGVVLTDTNITGRMLLQESRRPHGLRDSSVERVSVGAISRGRVLTNELGTPSWDIDRLRILDLTSEYQIGYPTGGRSVAFDLDCAAIGLTVDGVRTAINRGTATPMGDLLRRQLLEIADAAAALSPTELSAVGISTAQLVRGLVLSASHRDADRMEAMASTLLIRVQDYVNRHLAEPDMTPEHIAIAHNISLRQLYLVFSQVNETPADWIIARRLAAAKVDLTYTTNTVSATAQRWGFKDHSHFSRRFKATYGLTPLEYSRRVRENAVLQVLGQTDQEPQRV